MMPYRIISLSLCVVYIIFSVVVFWFLACLTNQHSPTGRRGGTDSVADADADVVVVVVVVVILRCYYYNTTTDTTIIQIKKCYSVVLFCFYLLIYLFILYVFTSPSNINARRCSLYLTVKASFKSYT